MKSEHLDSSPVPWLYTTTSGRKEKESRLEKGKKVPTIHWGPTTPWDTEVALEASLSHLILDWVKDIFGYINFIYSSQKWFNALILLSFESYVHRNLQLPWRQEIIAIFIILD